MIRIGPFIPNAIIVDVSVVPWPMATKTKHAVPSRLRMLEVANDVHTAIVDATLLVTPYPSIATMTSVPVVSWSMPVITVLLLIDYFKERTCLGTAIFDLGVSRIDMKTFSLVGVTLNSIDHFRFLSICFQQLETAFRSDRRF